MTSGAEPVFVDTNILVYASASGAPFHTAARSAVERLHDTGVTAWVSRQVLREYLATLTRPQIFAQPRNPVALASDVRRFQARFRVAEDSPAVTRRLLELLEEIPMGGKQVHDANIVATMQVHGVRRLLSANVTDFLRYAHLITIEPLTT